MARVKTLDCASCGGPLEVPAGRDSVECSYCGRVLAIERDRGRAVVMEHDHTRAEGGSDQTLADDLLRGYDGDDVGAGARHDVDAMRGRDWACYERGVWPVAARSSSSFGVSWSHDVTVGAPRVYPRYGDRPGAWAPRRQTSHTEWIEVIYPPDAPAVDTIRVFETCAAGATFAVTARRPGERDRLVWQRRPVRPMTGAQVVEIALDEPQKLASVRAYVTNDRKAWAQIDTIGLVAVEPVAKDLRRRPAPPPLVSGGTALAIAVTLIALIGGGLVLYRMAGSMTDDAPGAVAPDVVAPDAVAPDDVATTGPPPTAPNGQPPVPPVKSIPPPPPSVPPTSVAGAALAPWDAEALAAAAVQWATRARGASSQYGRDRWSYNQAAGAPDVFPTHADNDRAWASQQPDAGPEWITVEFGDDPAGAVAEAIVIVETFHPGALARVDDVSGADEVTLWTGRTDAAQASRLLRLALPQPRRIRALRLVLDTRRASGWNEIDAVGLVTAAARGATSGDNARGDNARGDNAPGGDPRGDNARGDNARGDNARGDNARGDNARGGDPRGGNPRGSNDGR